MFINIEHAAPPSWTAVLFFFVFFPQGRNSPCFSRTPLRYNEGFGRSSMSPCVSRARSFHVNVPANNPCVSEEKMWKVSRGKLQGWVEEEGQCVQCKAMRRKEGVGGKANDVASAAPMACRSDEPSSDGPGKGRRSPIFGSKLI